MSKQPPKPELIMLSLDELYISHEISSRKSGDYDSQQTVERLAASIYDHGMLTPLLVCKIQDSPSTDHKRYCLVSGFFRVLAIKYLVQTTDNRKWLCNIPASVISTTTNTALVQLIESKPRIELSPIDEANAIRSALDLSSSIHETKQLTVEQIARAIGVSKGYVNVRLKLLRFPVEIQDMLHTKQLTMTHAHCLLKWAPESSWKELAARGCRMDVSMFMHYVRSLYDDSYRQLPDE